MPGSNPGNGLGEAPPNTDTIFAPATATGRAAIAVIRLSGPDAARAVSVLAGEIPPPRYARRRRLADPATGEPLDDGLVLWFPAPNSATGEDVAEFHLHGSRAVLAAVIEVLTRLGLRLAEPGEFTRRAFLNGKLDLTQAEAIADLAAAETEAQRRQALRQLDGALGDLYRDWSRRLTHILAHLEAAIDFPDEDLPPEIEDRIRRRDRRSRRRDRPPSRRRPSRRKIARRHRVAIIGPPNAGKSSLLNRIARREAAITSPIAGTTRDIVEVAIDLAGYPVVLADTAGLRDSADAIEQEGLRRARARAEEAEIRLFVFDARHPAEAAAPPPGPAPRRSWSPTRSTCSARATRLPARARFFSRRGTNQTRSCPDLFRASTRRPVVRYAAAAVDSRDKPGHDDQGSTSADFLRDAFPISALTGAGLDPLLAALAARIARNLSQRSPGADPRPPPPGARRRARHRCAARSPPICPNCAPKTCASRSAASAGSPASSMSKTCST